MNSVPADTIADLRRPSPAFLILNHNKRERNDSCSRPNCFTQSRRESNLRHLMTRIRPTMSLFTYARPWIVLSFLRTVVRRPCLAHPGETRGLHVAGEDSALARARLDARGGGRDQDRRQHRVAVRPRDTRLRRRGRRRCRHSGRAEGRASRRVGLGDGDSVLAIEPLDDVLGDGAAAVGVGEAGDNGCEALVILLRVCLR